MGAFPTETKLGGNEVVFLFSPFLQYHGSAVEFVSTGDRKKCLVVCRSARAAQSLPGVWHNRKVRSEALAVFEFLSKGRCDLSAEVLAFGVLLKGKDQEKMPKYSSNVFPEL